MNEYRVEKRDDSNESIVFKNGVAIASFIDEKDPYNYIEYKQKNEE